jgi:membrane associated rhomboid family serine protease
VLLPYGLESSLRRLPVATFTLIGLCVVAFLLQLALPGASDDAIGEKITEIYKYYYSHQGLSAPESILPWLTESSRLSSVLSATLEADDAPTATATEQTTFNNLVKEYETMLHSRPTWRFGFHSQGNPLGLLLHMFLHGGWAHLLSNMWILWLVGFKIEDLWGRWVYLALYLVGGLVAAMAHVLITGSDAPMVGASGAIAALMGAFLLRLYKTRIQFVYFGMFFFRPVFKRFSLAAYVVLPFWFVKEGLIAATGQSGNVATWAHLAGFAFGVVVAFIFRVTNLEQNWLTDGQKREEIKGIEELDQAEAYVMSGMGRQAEEPLNRYLKLHPEDAYAWELLARARRETNGDYQSAVKRTVQLYLKQQMPARAAQLLEYFNFGAGLKMTLHLLAHFENPEELLGAALSKELSSPYAPKAALILAERFPSETSSELVQRVYERTTDLEWQERLERQLIKESKHPTFT